MMKRLTTFALIFCFATGVLFAQNDPEAHHKAGLQYIGKRQYIEAIKEFTEAISLKNTFAESYFQRALAKKMYCDETGSINYDFCSDLIKAVQNGYWDASSMLIKECSSECYSLDAAMMEPEKVFCADFSRSKISSLPQNFKNLSRVTHLNISDNDFTLLDEKISEKKLLFFLDFSNNKIKSLPDWLSSLPYLVELYANDNALEQLSPKIGSMLKLQNIQVRNNYLSDLPKEMVNLSNLTSLDISFNEFTNIPEVLFAMKNLKFLDMSGNEISDEEKQKLIKALPKTEIKF
jgi:hypothetical protein